MWVQTSRLTIDRGQDGFFGGFIIRWQTLHGKVHLGPPLGLICGTHAALSSLLRVTHAVESSCGVQLLFLEALPKL